MSYNNRIKAIGCLVLLILLSNAGMAQLPMGNVPGRNKQSLNGKWQVVVDWYNRGNGIENNDTSVNKNTFREYRFDSPTLNVPGDWNSQRAE